MMGAQITTPQSSPQNSPGASPQDGADERPPAPLGRFESALAGVGSVGLAARDEARSLSSLLMQTLWFSLRGRREKGALTRQIFEQGYRSLVFISVFMGFFGMISVYQAGLQALRIIPDLTMLGPTFLQLLVRDLAASIGALMLATRVGAGIAAEIGSMVVTEQVDALRMSAADPVEYLVVPRFLGGIIATTTVLIWAAGVAWLSGLLTAWSFFGVLPRTFANASAVRASDVIMGLTKCVVYGATIPLVSSHAGLSTYGGSAGVGLATTRAVVNSSLAVIMLNLIISAIGLLVFRG